MVATERASSPSTRRQNTAEEQPRGATEAIDALLSFGRSPDTWDGDIWVGVHKSWGSTDSQLGAPRPPSAPGCRREPPPKLLAMRCVSPCFLQTSQDQHVPSGIVLGFDNSHLPTARRGSGSNAKGYLLPCGGEVLVGPSHTG